VPKGTDTVERRIGMAELKREIQNISSSLQQVTVITESNQVEIAATRDDIAATRVDMATTQKDITSIKRGLFGSAEFCEEGLVGKVREQEKYVWYIKWAVANWKALAALVSVFGTAGIAGIVYATLRAFGIK